MALEDDLKSRTLALISQQMANWVVEIQRAIQGHQAALVRSLDELQETVARYDEKVDEQEIASAMSEVVAQQPPAAGGAELSILRASIAAIEKGTNLSDVLGHVVAEASKQVQRAAMFIVKGPNVIGWQARGISHPDAIKSVTIPLTADTVFRLVAQSRRAERTHVSNTPATAQALGRLGGDPQGMLAVPLILREKVAAVLYCDSQEDEIPAGTSDSIEILVSFAGKVIDLLSAAPRATQAGTSPGTSPGAVRPPAPAAPPAEEGAATLMFAPGTVRPPPPRPSTIPPGKMKAPVFTPAPPMAAPPPPPPPARGLAPEDQKAHEDAKRFARLVVSEIKLYNESKVAEGRKTKDIYERLKEDIERGRQMYNDRVSAQVRGSTDYFQDELVRILAGGDPGALGSA